MPESKHKNGYTRALELLKQCATPDGFLASTTDRDNYRRIWSRDGCIISLACLLTGDEELQNTVLSTLRTLIRHQGPHGEIPSNVDAQSGRVSYGGTTGRVDGDLWFLIACGAYFRQTGDEKFLEEFFQAMEKIIFLLGAWEFNNRGLIYIPHTGDWSDEYIQHGYILYDQLLYWKALDEFCAMEHVYRKKKDQQLCSKISILRDLIGANYWFVDCDLDERDAYHPVLYRKGCQAASHGERHWMAFFSPMGYGYRFDALANILASLFGIADEQQSNIVDEFIQTHVVQNDVMLLPAFHPVITPVDDTWNNLQVSFSYVFKNKPYEFHNGGLWPFVTGFYVADLEKRGKGELADRYMHGINNANALDSEGGEWGFYEYHHGKDHTPGGTRHQGWSAAAAVIGYHALEGDLIF